MERGGLEEGERGKKEWEFIACNGVDCRPDGGRPWNSTGYIPRCYSQHWPSLLTISVAHKGLYGPYEPLVLFPASRVPAAFEKPATREQTDLSRTIIARGHFPVQLENLNGNSTLVVVLFL